MTGFYLGWKTFYSCIFISMLLEEQIDVGYTLEIFPSFLILRTFCLLMSEYCNTVMQLSYFLQNCQLLPTRSVIFLDIPHSQEHHFHYLREKIPYIKTNKQANRKTTTHPPPLKKNPNKQTTTKSYPTF